MQNLGLHRIGQNLKVCKTDLQIGVWKIYKEGPFIQFTKFFLPIQTLVSLFLEHDHQAISSKQAHVFLIPLMHNLHAYKQPHQFLRSTCSHSHTVCKYCLHSHISPCTTPENFQPASFRGSSTPI